MNAGLGQTAPTRGGLDEVPLSEAEADYVEAARAANTLRGYRSDWREFTSWCDRYQLDPTPAAAATISTYLTELARAGAKVGTMSRRLSAIKFIHQLQDHPDPTRNARVTAVWEGIRRTHGAPPDRAAALMPPDLFDVLDACPTIKTWKTKGRPDEPDLAGARDRAMLLVGFVAAPSDNVCSTRSGVKKDLRMSKRHDQFMIAQLDKLDRLLGSGEISRNEYDLRKKRFLERSNSSSSGKKVAAVIVFVIALIVLVRLLATYVVG